VPAGLSRSQIVICQHIAKGGEEAGCASMQELMEMLPNKPSRQALHFSIKFLEQKGIAQSVYRTRHGSRHRIVTLTPEGFERMKYLTGSV
jgi:DNA-binding PadR family transcriptional regulator